MLKFAANLSMMFNEVAFSERFQRAAAAGFGGVEYLFPYEMPADDIAALLERHDLTQVLFNLPAGDWQAGERGLASVPGREAEFERSVATAIEYAGRLNCHRLHAMAGLLQSDASREEQHRTYIRNLRYAAGQCESRGIRLLIEPINDRDMPGYFLTTARQAEAVLAEVAHPNLYIQLDLYHCQIMAGDLLKTIERLWDRLGHIQVASVPARREPDGGEVNYPWLFEQLERLGYEGWIGCEYRPAGRTEDGLGWLEVLRG